MPSLQLAEDFELAVAADVELHERVDRLHDNAINASRSFRAQALRGADWRVECSEAETVVDRCWTSVRQDTN